MAGELIYIGIAHADPRGTSRLEKLLNHIEPDMITVEMTDEKLKLVKSAREEVCLALEKNGVSSELARRCASLNVSSPYEWIVSQEYAKQQGIQAHKVDIRTKELDAIDKTIIDKLKGFTKEEVEEELRIYDQFASQTLMLDAFDAQLYSKTLLKWYVSLPVTPALLKERDEFMAGRISHLKKENPDSRIVHAGGALHMVENENAIEKTLYMLLPPDKVYFLPEADNL